MFFKQRETNRKTPKRFKIEKVYKLYNLKNNMKVMIMIMMMVVLISLTSAVDIYAGESYNETLTEPYSYYSIVGNSTEVNVSVSQVGNVVTIIPDKYSQTDSYEIIFYAGDGTVISSSGGSGGSKKGGGTYYYPKTNNTTSNTTDTSDEVVTTPNPVTEIETIKELPLWFFIGFIGFVLFGFVITGYIIYRVFLKEPEPNIISTERGYENNEQKNNVSNDDSVRNFFS